MVGGLITAAAGAFFGRNAGRYEADWAKARADDKVYDPLPHAALVAYRLLLAASVALLTVGPGRSMPTAMLLFMVGFTPAHRLSYNLRSRANGLSRTRAWWYMGSCRRRAGDSLYDTLCWLISARSVRVAREGKRRYLLIRPWSYAMPFFVALAIEAAGLFLGLALH